MNRRDLDFRDFDSLAADVQCLHDGGYDQAGGWNLAQACSHLTISMERSLDGFPNKAPWVLRKILAPMIKGKMFRTRKINAGYKAPEGFTVDAETDEKLAVDRFLQVADRVKNRRGGFHNHPVFDQLTDDQWHQFHLIHGSLHLSFLIPKK